MTNSPMRIFVTVMAAIYAAGQLAAFIGAIIAALLPDRQEHHPWK